MTSYYEFEGMEEAANGGRNTDEAVGDSVGGNGGRNTPESGANGGSIVNDGNGN